MEPRLYVRQCPIHWEFSNEQNNKRRRRRKQRNLICKISNLSVIRFVKKNKAEKGSKESIKKGRFQL